MAIVQICGVVLLAALVHAQSEGCFNAMKCVTNEVSKALFAKNRTELCRLAPGVIACAEKENSQCEDEYMATTNAGSINQFKESAKSCPVLTTTTQMTTLTVKKCAEQFKSCLTSEFQRYSEQNQEEEVCNELPGIIECLEKAVSSCQRTEDQQVEKITAVLENIRKQFANSKCAASADEDTEYDSAPFLVTSIMQTCIALILAILLH